MLKVKLILKEFIFIPFLLFLLMMLFSKLNLTNLFDSSLEYFYEIKLIFTTVLVLIALESFLMFDLPKNLLFSRTISSLVMMITFFLLAYFIDDIKEIVWIMVSFIVGGGTSYVLQRFVNFKKGNLISVILLVLATITFIALTYTNVI